MAAGGRGTDFHYKIGIAARLVCSPVQAVDVPDLGQVLLVANPAGNHRRSRCCISMHHALQARTSAASRRVYACTVLAGPVGTMQCVYVSR